MSVGSIFKEPGFVGFPTEIGLKTVFSKPYYILYPVTTVSLKRSINHLYLLWCCFPSNDMFLKGGLIGIR